jgi:hypothetical protein
MASNGPPTPRGPPPPQQRRPPPPTPPRQPTPTQSYDDEDEDDEGALGATINLVASAASMFFKPKTRAAAPPPSQPTPPRRGPPPPIDDTPSMLDSMEATPQPMVVGRQSVMPPTTTLALQQPQATLPSGGPPPTQFTASPRVFSNPRAARPPSPRAALPPSPRAVLPPSPRAARPPSPREAVPTLPSLQNTATQHQRGPPPASPLNNTNTAVNVFGKPPLQPSTPISAHATPVNTNTAVNVFGKPPSQPSTPTSADATPVNTNTALNVFGKPPSQPSTPTSAHATPATTNTAVNVFGKPPSQPSTPSSAAGTPVTTNTAVNVFGKPPSQPSSPSSAAGTPVTTNTAVNVFGKPPSQPSSPVSAHPSPPYLEPHNGVTLAARPAALIQPTLSSEQPVAKPLSSSQTIDLRPAHGQTSNISRSTPPSSPKFKVQQQPETPETPQITNQSLEDSHSPPVQGTKSSPTLKVNTPLRRQLRAPPRAQLSPRTVSDRPKFRLPPARKKVAPIATTSASSSQNGIPARLETPITSNRKSPEDVVTPKVEGSSKVQVEPEPYGGLSQNSDEKAAPPLKDKKAESKSKVESTKEPNNSTLPDGWTESVDPTSGGLFYYHVETRETSWERPQADELLVAQTVKPPVETEQILIGSANTDAPIQVGTPSLDTKMPSGKIPIAEDAKLERTIPTSLPEGWTEMEDPSSGGSYFYNRYTQETSWTCPLPVDGAPVESTGTKGNEPSQETVMENSIAITQENTSTAALPVDGAPVESTGTKENEPSQAIVMENSIGANGAIIDENGAPLGEGPRDDEAEAIPCLPDGWIEGVDQSCGRTYFYNSDTAETSWERPIGIEANISSVSDEAADERAAASAEVDTTIDELMREFATTPQEDETAVAAGEVDTTIDAPMREFATPPEEDQPQGVAKEQPEITVHSLPADWTESVDPQTGRTYFYNVQTRETSWERPAVTEVPVCEESLDRNTNTMFDVTDEMASYKSADAIDIPEELQQRGTAITSLPAGWTEALDPTSSRTYYYNSLTRETSWEHPSGPEIPEAGNAGLSLQSQEDIMPVSLDDGEHHMSSNHSSGARGSEGLSRAQGNDERKDIPSRAGTGETDQGVVASITGQRHDINIATPEPFLECSTLDESHAESEGMEEDKMKSECEDLTSVEENEYEGLAPESYDKLSTSPETTSVLPLPEYWTQAADPSTGETYYFNTLTQETSWKRPGNEKNAITEDVFLELRTADGVGGVEPEDDIVDPTMPEQEAPMQGENVEDDAPPVGAPEETSSTALPVGWTEVVDPSSEQIYYYNIFTDETSWELPNVDASLHKGAEERVVDPAIPEQEAPMQSENVEDDAPPIGAPEETSSMALPVGWTQVVDPSSEEIYYYNTITEETSWELPIEYGSLHEGAEDGIVDIAEDDIVDPAIPEQDAAMQSENAEDDAPPEGAPEETSSTDLPNGWTEVMDPSSEQMFYYNPITQETSWERPTEDGVVDGEQEANTMDLPTSEQETDMPIESVEDDQPPLNAPEKTASTDLPVGWTEVVDPSSEEIYYHNTITQETSWELPGADGSLHDGAEDEIVETTEDGIVNTAIPEQDAAMQSENAEDDAPPEGAPEETSSTDLPEGWTEVVDPSSEQMFYYNTITQETSWELPTADGVVDGEQEANTVDLPISEQETDMPIESVKDDEPPLDAPEETPFMAIAEGWTEVVDPSSEQIYYYNTITEETSWELPGADGAVDREREANAVDLPISQHETQVPVENMENDEPSLDAPEETSSTNLPKGWTEVVDPSTDAIYYYNTSTEETSWELPGAHETVGGEPDANAGDFPIPELETQVPIENVEEDEHPLDSPEKTSSIDLPEGWTEVVDPSSDALYYYNTITQETSWELPGADETVGGEPDDNTGDLPNLRPEIGVTSENVEGDEPPLDAPEETSSMAIPEGWTEVLDPSSEQIYYYNSLTQETSWELPCADGGFDGEQVDTTDDLPIPEPEIGVTIENVEDDELPLDDPEETLALPEGWTEVVDPSSEQIYYHNTLTQETSWELPSADCVFGVEQEDNTVDLPIPVPETGVTSENVEDDELPLDASEETLALPEGWTEVVDPSSEQMFYYNTITQETSWELPTADGVVDGEQEANTVDLPSIEPEIGVTSENVEDDEPPLDAPEETLALSEGWTEVVDPSSEQIYYYNTITEETSWEFPSAEGVFGGEQEDNTVDLPSIEPEIGVSSENVEDDEPPLDAPEETLALSEGWTEVVDPSSEQIYYYNTITEETSWEFPSAEGVFGGEQEDNTVDLPSIEPEIGVSGENVEDDEPALDTPEETSPINLPQGWNEVVDPSSEQIYYYNTTTQETSWELPGADGVMGGEPEATTAEAFIQEQEVQVPIENVEDDEPPLDAPEKASYESLSEGWTEVVDPSSEEIYYYNTITQETSWELPIVDGALHDGAEDRIDETTEDDIVYPAISEQDAAMQSENAEDDAPPEGAPEDSPLPSGWIELIDPSSGDAYYFNEVTNETSWATPIEAPGSTNAELFLSGNTVEGGESSRGELDAPVGGVDDPEYERPMQLEETFDGPSDVTQEDPGEKQSPLIESEAPTKANEILCPGWIELLDPTSGNIYYFNEEDNSTSWDRPVLISIERDSPFSNDEDTRGNQNVGEVDAHTGAARQEEDLTPVSRIQDAGALAVGWVELADPSSGEKYYLNEAENRTSWDRPVEPAQPCRDPNKVFGKNADESRPAHALGIFGFGGKLCTWNSLPDGLNQIEISRASSLVPPETALRVEECRHRCGITGPLNSSDDSLVLSYIESKVSENPSDLLWRLILIAAESNGRLRSDDGVTDNSSPEAAIVELLLREDDSVSDVRTPARKDSPIGEGKSTVPSADQ